MVSRPRMHDSPRLNETRLIFAQADKVDMIWSKLARTHSQLSRNIILTPLLESLVSGPLSSTCAYSAKVATSPKSDTPNYQHVMCLYMPDVYDKDAVTEVRIHIYLTRWLTDEEQVMKVLLRNHGMNLTGVKSNLYTSISLDSKHASGVQSTVSLFLPNMFVRAKSRWCRCGRTLRF